jgi:hypothetical protein
MHHEFGSGQKVFDRYTLVKILGRAGWELFGWHVMKNWTAK